MRVLPVQGRATLSWNRREALPFLHVCDARRTILVGAVNSRTLNQTHNILHTPHSTRTYVVASTTSYVRFTCRYSYSYALRIFIFLLKKQKTATCIHTPPGYKNEAIRNMQLTASAFCCFRHSSSCLTHQAVQIYSTGIYLWYYQHSMILLY